MYITVFIVILLVTLIMIFAFQDQFDRFLKFLNIEKVKGLPIFIGLLLIFFSMTLLAQEPGYTSFSPGAQSSSRWGYPIHNRVLFFVFFSIGILTVITSFERKSEKKDATEKHIHSRICISCGVIQNKVTKDLVVCPKCGGTVENIKGIKERYPELKKKSNKKP